MEVLDLTADMFALAGSDPMAEEDGAAVQDSEWVNCPLPFDDNLLELAAHTCGELSTPPDDLYSNLMTPLALERSVAPLTMPPEPGEPRPLPLKRASDMTRASLSPRELWQASFEDKHRVILQRLEENGAALHLVVA